MSESYHTNPINTMNQCPRFRPSQTDPVKVMVYSQGGEPAVLNAVDDLGNAILVYGDNARKTLGYPRRYVFAFDEDLFGKLLEAYGNNDCDDTPGLSDLWEQAVSV